jgi:hypothetical protein
MKLYRFLHDLSSSESQITVGVDTLFHVYWLFYLSVRLNQSRSLRFSIHFKGQDKHHSCVCGVRDCWNFFERHTAQFFFPVRRIEEKIHDLQLQYPHPYGHYLSTAIARTVGEYLRFQSLAFCYHWFKITQPVSCLRRLIRT